MSRKTPNQKIYEEQLSELKKRLNKLSSDGADIENIKLPTTPSTYTQKQIKELSKIEEQITAKETEARRIRIRAKKQYYDDMAKQHNNAKRNFFEAQNKGNKHPKSKQSKVDKTKLNKGNKINKNANANKSVFSTLPTPKNTIDTLDFEVRNLYHKINIGASNNAVGGIIFKQLFDNIKGMYGDVGLVDFVRTAQANGYNIEDYIYESDVEKILNVISEITEYLNEDEYEELKDLVYKVYDFYTENENVIIDNMFETAQDIY